MTDDLDHPSRAGRRAWARERIRRITSGLEDEADAAANGALLPKHRRLAPVEHWHPQTEQTVEESAAPAEPKQPPAAPARPPEPQALRAPAQPRRLVRIDRVPRTPPDPAAEGGASAPESPAAQRAAVSLESSALPKPSAFAALRSRLQRLAHNPRWTASWLDRLLIMIEVTATLGLVASALVSFGMVDRLQQDLARLAGPLPAPTVLPAAPPPTFTPLPTAAATAIPSASAPATEAVLPGGRSAQTPVATPSAQPPSLAEARIIIPAIRVDAPIVEGDDWDTLRGGVGHHIGSALPGEADNMVLSAHNDVYGAIFKSLGDLREGDLVLIDTPAMTYRYQVTSIRIVTPKETSVMDPTSKPTLTLITCYPPLVDTHRIVVAASFVK